MMKDLHLSCRYKNVGKKVYFQDSLTSMMQALFKIDSLTRYCVFLLTCSLKLYFFKQPHVSFVMFALQLIQLFHCTAMKTYTKT
jgi:hypothetical protein